MPAADPPNSTSTRNGEKADGRPRSPPSSIGPALPDRVALSENENATNTRSRPDLTTLSLEDDQTVRVKGHGATSSHSTVDGGRREAQRSSVDVDLRGWTEVKGKGTQRSRAFSEQEKREKAVQKQREWASSPSIEEMDISKISKLSPDKLIELASSPDALPLQSPKVSREIAVSTENDPSTTSSTTLDTEDYVAAQEGLNGLQDEVSSPSSRTRIPHLSTSVEPGVSSERPSIGTRATSTPLMKRKPSSNKANGITPISIPKSRPNRPFLDSLQARDIRHDYQSRQEELLSSPFQHSIPIPPLSVPTHLHLEVSSNKPSPLYLYRSSDNDVPYEPTHIKLERLSNFLRLPPQLEQVLWFGTLACLDAWLYTFTILPIRFSKGISLLLYSWAGNFICEATFVTHIIRTGIVRLWKRRFDSSEYTLRRQPSFGEGILAPIGKKARRPSPARTQSTDGRSSVNPIPAAKPPDSDSTRSRFANRHRRTRSEPSRLLSVEKADILKGLLIISSSYILMYFDASMMYHNIRGQAAIKLYVIYNALEVFDRLLSALGQDILECLFAKETLDRNPNGRSKVIRPAWLFLLALIYNIVHATALFYQVITLNVAVNSYSNALLTLLMSNQFVEIKSTVFKKIEKENLFQMTCADVVERFQLWLMLIIIAARNIVETGGLLNAGGSTAAASEYSSSLLPHSFTLLPDWVGQVMSPFFFVLGTETLVDWVKHAYITKFNATKPKVYGRFLDVLAKDYYSNAFTDPNLTRRLGLPTIPLSCLFIRASVQTYHMFLATHASSSSSPPATTSLTEDFPSPESTPALTAALAHIDRLFKRAIFGIGSADASTDPSNIYTYISIPFLNSFNAYLPSLDTVLTHLTALVFFSLLFLVLLVLKLLLGMALLSFARNRYAGMKRREQESSVVESKRVGGWGAVETGEERRRWIYEDDEGGLRKRGEREKEKEKEKDKGGKGGGGLGLGGVERYAMVGKRIW